MKAVKTLTVFCLIVFFNCLFNFDVSGQNTVNTTSVDQKSAEVTEIKAANSESQTSARRQDEKYRIGFQDALEIQVSKHPELSQTVNVGSDGTILMPRINTPITVVCKTERELKETVETLYRTYLKNPFVNVRVVEQRSQPVAVMGAVEKPGAFNLNRKIRLLELLSFAGGPKVEKAGSKIQVARVGNSTTCIENAEASSEEDVKVSFLSYKLNDVQKGIENPWVQPGDMVTVMEAEEAYVVGDVKEPTKVSLKETVTLTQAIAKAGGIKSEAKTSKVRIQRQEANSPLKTELVFDLKEIASMKISDPILQANDIVEVPKDGFKAIRNGVLKAISGGVGGLFMRF